MKWQPWMGQQEGWKWGIALIVAFLLMAIGWLPYVVLGLLALFVVQIWASIAVCLGIVWVVGWPEGAGKREGSPE